MIRWIVIIVAIFFNLSCSSLGQSPSKAASGSRKAQRFLEQAHAEYRASLISQVRYQLSMDITQSDVFSGISKISFFLKEPQDLTLDFNEGEVLQLVVNSQPVEKIDYNKFFIVLPKNKLKGGENQVEVTFRRAYSATGSGLYRFVDPVDQKVYLYSDFEPYDAHLMFPCFDQPDLKATYQTKVLAPKNWTVVSSTRETSIKSMGSAVEWIFPESGIFSTYIYSLHAGPYKIWNSQAKTKTQTIPLRLMARQSLAKYVDTKMWFETTQKGFSFFEDFFGYPYAYKKYDQLLVPDFNSGAMENVAAVTFNERAVSRTKQERFERRRVANVILHEMAHMWFGNLVTMKWWNDIWLNESFATFAAYKALADATEFKEAWSEFYSQKRAAYQLDQGVATHPIEFEVPNTDVVFANFDAITYGKGASVLKQLHFYLGEENFKNGLKSYFYQNAFKNTQLKDFTGALSTAAGVDLKTWERSWLKVPQVNSAKLDFVCQNGKITKPQLIQTAVAEYPTLRQHKTQIAVYALKNKTMSKVKSFSIVYDGATTSIPALEGIDCSTAGFIDTNDQDYDYAKLELDARSLLAVQEGLSAFTDDMVRARLWGALWDMVREQNLLATAYVDIVLKHTLQEQNADVFSAAASKVGFVLKRAIPQGKLGQNVREKLQQKWVAHLLKGAKQAKNIDLQKRWFDLYVDSLETPPQLAEIAKMLDQNPSWLKFSIDQDRRWALLNRLSTFGYAGIDQRLTDEKKKDPSRRGQESYLMAMAAQPSFETKKQSWEQIIQGPTADRTLGSLRPVIWGLFPVEQEETHKKFSEDFYQRLLAFKKQPPEFLSAFTQLAPAFCSADSANRLKTFASRNQQLPPRVLKSLKISAEEDERCLKIRAKLMESLKI